MTQYTKQDNGQASDMMWDAGQGGAGPWVHCSCGVDHALDPDLSEEEYDASESFEYIDMDGQLFVYDCKGCAERLLKYEKFIWNNRNHIRRYLKIRIDQEKAWADQEHLINVLSNI